MNKVYKVVWNASIGAWVATSELAKSRTKTKSKISNLTAAVLVGAISFSPAAFAAQGIENGKGPGTGISSAQCVETQASAGNRSDIAIGCGSKTTALGRGSLIADRNNPYNNTTGAFADGGNKEGGSIAFGTGANVEKGLGTAIGSYASVKEIAGVAIGTGALSAGNTALAIGRQSAAIGDFSQAIGNVAAATGKGSLAIGHSATAEGYRSIAIGSPDIENAGSVAGQAGASYQPNMATKATGKDSIAFGGGAVATQENSLAIGAFSSSTGKKSVAIGTGAKANKDDAVVIGDQAEASFDGGVAVGKGARSEAENSIALGKDSKATQATGESFLTKQAAPTGVLSIGDVGAERRIQNVADGAVDSDAATVRQLKAARTHYVSVNDNGVQGGNYENDGAKGLNSIAVGVNASSAGREAMAMGSGAQAVGSGSVAMGASANTVGRGDVAIGRGSSTKGAEGINSNQSIAIGDQTKAIGDQSVAIGADVIARGNSSVAIGGDDVDKIARDTELSQKYTDITGGVLKAGSYPTTEANHGSTAVGTQALGTGAFSSAFGMTSKATGDASAAFGVMSNASGKGAAAFGAVAQATGDGASAMGINSLASGTNSTAIGSGNKPGEGATATGNGAAAIGSNAKATGDSAAAVGKGAEASNENAAAIGGGAKATGKNAAAIGGGALADQENAVAVGQGAQSLVVGGVALGARSRVEAENSVALGQDAVATEATGNSFLTNRDASMSNGVISVGSAGKERRITNVEDGAADSDAVTVRQLKHVDARVNENAQNITNLDQKIDNTKTDLGNQIADTNKNLNDAKTDLGNQINNTKTELNSKIDNTKTELQNKGLNFAGNAGADVHRNLGDKLNIVGGADAATAEDKTSGENVITRTTEDGIKIELLKDAKFDSITTGDSVLNNNGLTIKDGASITKDGINAGNKVITNVADGVNGKDAVNVDQLTKTKDGLDNKITDTNNKLDDAKKDLGNQITDTNNKLNDTKDQLTNQITDTKTELNSKIDNTKTELQNKGLNFAGNAGADVHRNLGDKLNIVGGADAATAEDKTSGENVITRTTADGIKIELLKDAKFDSITTGDSVLNNNGLTIKDGASITKDGINAGNKVIANVADGINGKDAVNVDQLTKTKDGLDNKITDTNNKLDDAKKDLGNQITDTNNKLNDTKDQLTNQITDTKTELNSKIDNTKTELQNKGLNFAGNAGKDVHRNLGDKFNIVGGADAATAEDKTSGENVITRTTADGIKIELLKDAKFDSITTGDSVLNNNGLTIKDGPSITKDGINAGNKVITNVADGVNGKDAVNVDQLTKTKDGLDNKITDTNNKLDDAKKDLGNQITDTNNKLNDTKDQLTTQITDTKTELNSKIDNTKTELENKGLNFAGNAGADVHRKLGDKLNIVGGADAATAEDKTSGENVITRTTADGIKIELLKDAKFDSITTGDSVLNNNGLTIKDGPSITKDGINAGNKVITNVADGSIANGSKDAVNGGQIKHISDSIKNSIGGNTTVNPDGSITTNNIGGTGKNNINDAISNVKDAATKAKTTVTEGDNIVVKETTNKDGSTNYEVSTKKDLTLDSVTTGDSVLNNNGLTIKDGASITKDGINAGNKVITNVADGSIANGSKDAVNGGQIKHISDSIKNSIGGNTTVNPDGSITTNNIGGTGKNNINDAIKSVDDKVTNGVNDLTNKGLNFAGNAGADVHRKLGDKLNIVGGADAATAEDKTSGENVITRTTADGIKIELLKDAKFDSITTGDSVLNNNGLTIKDGPSITKDGINAGNKVITNVADGSIANGSKDAVNGGQIKHISDSIKNSIGGNTTVNPDGSITTNNIGGTGKNNINDAISNVKDAATKAKTTVTEGDNIVVKETTNKDGSTNYEVSTKKDLTLDSVTTGDSVLNNNGLTIKDGPSITKDGINAGNKVITNVADGSIANGSKDAVNGGQIKNISDSIKNSIGGNTTVNQDGSITTNNIGGTGKNNINDAIKSVDDKVTNGVNDLTNKGLNFAGNAGKDVHRKLGDKLNIVGGADAATAEDKTSGENVITRTTEDGIKIELLKDAKFDSITTGNTVLNNNGLVIKGGPSITINGVDAGGKKITNVADGVDAKDAVNKGQLDKQINDVKDQIGKEIGDLSDNAVKYDKDKDGNVDKNSVTLGGGDKGTNLKNVADGKVEQGSKDAVNGGQLWDVKQNVDKNTNDIQNIQNNINNINNGKSGLVQQQDPKGEITVGKDTGGKSVNMAGKDGDRVIKGVDNGTIAKDSKEAVNGGQIHNISDSIKNSIGGNTTIDPKDGTIKTNNIGGTGKDNIHDAIGTLNQSNQELGNRITNLGDQLQQAFYDTNQRIDSVEKKANAGIAAAMALEAAPFVAGKYTYAAGAAYHGGENAVGVTLRKTSDNGRWSITGGVAAASQGEPSVRIGVSGVIN
ncbi:ESPR-type extended signal peptide-containing protein [Acinetobacter sp. 'aerobic (ED)']|uniref:ESPR-type extended signal peptide-containing protein n=1 Tax=Acinetobacter sp. 'aerobic (ED)' TaxID=174230 RepID=UPI00192B9CD0|nr:ESPR-type extended signal peptide-containing protein [Acinetobacter sp. 'aerobic (ED)']